MIEKNAIMAGETESHFIEVNGFNVHYRMAGRLISDEKMGNELAETITSLKSTTAKTLTLKYFKKIRGRYSYHAVHDP